MDLNPTAIRLAAETTLAAVQEKSILKPEKLVPNPRAPGMAPYDPIAIASDAVYTLGTIDRLLDQKKVAQAFYYLIAAQTALWCTHIMRSDEIEAINIDAIERSKIPA